MWFHLGRKRGAVVFVLLQLTSAVPFTLRCTGDEPSCVPLAEPPPETCPHQGVLLSGSHADLPLPLHTQPLHNRHSGQMHPCVMAQTIVRQLVLAVKASI